MKNKGLTIVELLATFILLGIIALIAIPATNRIKRESAENTFRESAKSVITAAQSYYAENNYENFPNDGMEVLDKRLKIKNQAVYENGLVLYNSAVGQFELQLLTDGNFCANGTLDDLVITNGNCQTDDKCFVFNSSTNTIEGYNYEDTTCPKNVVVPERINNVTVKHIGNEAFSSAKENLYCSSDEFKTGKTEVGGYERTDNKCLIKKLYEEIAFETNLRSISLPSSIETIGENAFAGSKIKILNLVKNEKLIEIKTGAFMGSLNLQSIELPKTNNIMKIDAYAFSDTGLKEIDFKYLKELVYIGTGAFTNTLISNLDLTDTTKLAYIGDGAFFSIPSQQVLLNIGNKTQIEYLGEFSFCETNFINQGWTNIGDYVTMTSLTNSCLSNYIEDNR